MLLWWIIYVISVLFLKCLRAPLFIGALWSPAGKGLTSWLSFVKSNCEVFTFPLVSWVRCDAWLYRFLIFTLFLTFILGFENKGDFNAKLAFYLNIYIFSSLSIQKYPQSLLKWLGIFQKMGGKSPIPLPRITSGLSGLTFSLNHLVI